MRLATQPRPCQASLVDTGWLKDGLTEAGLEPDEVEAAVSQLLERWRRRRPMAPREARLAERVTDPLLSFSRLLEDPLEAALPLVDRRARTLSSASTTHLLVDAGLDPVVAAAYAKVVIEVMTIEALYEPLWRALGRAGPLELETLAGMDWASALD